MYFLCSFNTLSLGAETTEWLNPFWLKVCISCLYHRIFWRLTIYVLNRQKTTTWPNSTTPTPKLMQQHTTFRKSSKNFYSRNGSYVNFRLYFESLGPPPTRHNWGLIETHIFRLKQKTIDYRLNLASHALWPLTGSAD